MRPYQGEELNHRSLYLRILRRLWLIPAVAIICAVLFGAAYTIYVTAFTGQRQYLETSKYYVHFAFNENTQTAYDSYNAYTWDDILYAHPTIRGAIEAGLPDGMTMEEAQEDTEAIVLSDIRLLTIEVTAATPEQARGLSEAIRGGLSDFGEVMEEFESIEFLSSDEPTLVVVSDRTNNAVILGATIGALTALLWLLIRETSSDALYVPEDVTRRYSVPFLGFTLRNGQAGDAVYGGDLLRQNLSRLPAGVEISVLSLVGSGRDAEVTAVLAAMTGAELRACELQTIPGESGGVIVVIPARKTGASAQAELLLQQLTMRGHEITGVVLADCDPGFLRIYYGTR